MSITTTSSALYSINKMQLTTTLLAATAALLTTASAGQVNFYSDTNCQNYIGERHPASFQTTGCVPSSPSFPILPLPIQHHSVDPLHTLTSNSGPAGSFSALWVTIDQQACSHTCGPMIICGDSSCSRRKATGIGRCETFNTGVWARNGCGQDMCGNA